jgi:antitoxin component YwqK of YwqJK toxin-antitoxin module
MYKTKTSFFKNTFTMITNFSYSGKINIGDNNNRTIVNISNGKKNGKLIYFVWGKIAQILNFLNDKKNGKNYDYDHNGNVFMMHL